MSKTLAVDTERRFMFMSFLLYAFLALLVLRGVLFEEGTLGARSDWGFPFFSEQVRHLIEKDAYVIDPFSGRIASYQSASFLLDGALGFLGYLGLDGESVSKAFCFFVLIVSGLSCCFLCREVNCGHAASFVGGIFYGLSPVMFNQFRIGHITYLFSYSIAPLLLTLFSRYTRMRFNLPRAILIGLLFSISWTQLQFSVMLFGVLFLYCFFGRNSKTILIRLKTLAVATALALAIHSPWILTSIFSPIAPSSVAQAFIRGDLTYMSGSVLDVLRLQAFPVGGSFRDFVCGIMVPISFICPILAFAAIYFRPRNRTTLYFSLLAVVGLFLGQGVNPPLGLVVEWLFGNIKYLAIFREIYHISFVPTFAYSVLIAISTDAIRQRTRNPINFRISANKTMMQKSLRVLRRDSVVIIAIAFIISISVWPMFTGNLNGQLQVYRLSENHQRLYDFLKSSNGNYTVFWLPATSVSFTNYSYFTSQLKDTQRDPMMAFCPVPYLDADSGVKYNRYPAFLDRTVALQKTKYFGQLLGPTNCEYIITREDVRSRYLYPNPWNQSTVLEGLDKVNVTKNFGHIRLFRNYYAKPLIYAPASVAFAAGDLSILWYLPYFTNFSRKELPMLLFTADLSDAEMRTLSPLVKTVIILGDDYLEYVFAHLSSVYKISPAPYANYRLRQEGWTPYGQDWSDLYVSTSLYDGVITLAPDLLNVPVQIEFPGEYELWIRVYFGPDASSISYLFDGQEVMNLTTTTAIETGFKWVKMGEANLNSGKHFIKVRSGLGKNMIDEFLIAPISEMKKSFQESREEISQKNIIILVKPHSEPEEPFLASQTWGIESSGGYTLRSSHHGKTTIPLFVPKDGPYRMYLRGTNVTSFSKISINNKPIWATSTSTEERQVNREINIHDLNSWNAILSSKSFSTDYVMESNVSLHWSFVINKSANKDHELNLHFRPEDWSSFDQVGFWIFPKRTRSKPDTQIFFHLKNAAGEWIGGPKYIFSNKWTYVTLDLTKWPNRTNVDFVRFLVGDPWGEYSQGENVTFYISGGFLENVLREPSLLWNSLGLVEINKGKNIIELESQVVGTGLDLIAFEYSDSCRPLTAYAEVNFSRISPVDYRINLFTNETTFLLFGREFDKGWVARIDGKELPHFVVNSFENLFYVNQTGHVAIEIRFNGEPYYELGLWFSALTITLSVVLICCTTLKRYFNRRNGA